MNNRSLAKVADEFGTPFYLFDKDRFVTNVNDLNDCFNEIYSNFQLAYSFKTNYATCVCREAKKLGMYAEVVSPIELHHAIELGFKHIIYNGVCKTEKSIFEAVNRNAIINIDSLTDFRKLVVSAGYKRPKIGLRLNIDIRNGINSRFGVVPYSADYDRIIEEADAYGIEIVGLHCHICKARDIGSWESRCNAVLKIADEFPYLKYIDMGSNLYSRMHDDLRSQFEGDIPSYEDYAYTIASRFKRHYPEENVKLILETGTPVISDTVDVVSRVIDIKKIRGQMFAVLDVSKFDVGAICIYKDAPIDVVHVSNRGQNRGNYKITGYTCIEDDVLKDSYKGPLAIGDIVVFKNAGAYSVSCARNFIMPSIPMFQCSNRNGEIAVDIVKRCSCYEDVFGLFTSEAMT